MGGQENRLGQRISDKNLCHSVFYMLGRVQVDSGDEEPLL